MPRHYKLAVGAAISLALSVFALLSGVNFGQLSAKKTVAQQPTAHLALTEEQQTQSIKTQLQAAHDMQDIQVDGDIVVTATGDVLINEQLRNLFDYINTAFAHYPVAQRTAWLTQFMASKNLPAAKTTYLLGFYKHYSLYKQQEIALTASLKPAQHASDIMAVQTAKQQVSALQQQHLTTVEIMGFYGADQAYDDYQIQSALILNNTTLTEVAKATALAAARNTLPDSVKAQVMQTTVLAELEQLSADVKQQGSSASELYKLRAQLVGAAAAGRLAQMDSEDAHWQQRIAQYQQHKQAVLDNPALTSIEQNQAILELTTGNFNATERLRLKAYE